MKKFYKYLSTLLCASMVFSTPISVYAQDIKLPENDKISVSDFGAIANDDKDDSLAIQKAIDYAIENNISKIEFDDGVYNFYENPIGGSKDKAYLYIDGANNLKLTGKKDSNGNILTTFVRHNPGGDNVDLRQLLWADNCKNFCIENINFDMDTPYYTACDINNVYGYILDLTVAEGFPVPSEMNYDSYHLPLLYDKTSNTFYDQRLIWTNEDGSDVPKFNSNKKDPKNIKIFNKEIALKTKKAINDKGKDNLLLVFFQGHYTQSAKMIYFYNCENLELENINIFNGTGFPLTCDFCRNIKYKNVKAEPKEGFCAVAPRDCFKLYCCSGDIVLDNVTMDGFEDDGQNCHGMFSTINKIIDDHTFIANLTQVVDSRPEWLENTEIRFLSADTNDLLDSCIIEAAVKLDDSHWQIKTKDILPDGLVCTDENEFKGTTIFELGAYLADSWTVKNCTIRNTYRGLKISAQNVLVENCLFENNVYGIYMGAENDEWWHESQNPRHVVIKNNVFKNPLSGVAIDMDFHSYKDALKYPLIDDIQIYNNVFENCDIGVYVRDAKNVYIYNNDIADSVNTFIKLESNSVSNIYNCSKEDSFNIEPLEIEQRKIDEENERQAKIKSRNKKIAIAIGATCGLLLLGGFTLYIVKKR